MQQPQPQPQAPPQPQPMIPMMPSLPPTNITTEQIQKWKLGSFELLDDYSTRKEYFVKYLDENKRLILAILDNQNLGKLAECAQFQAQLQRNLMYLAAIADAQPQAPTMPPQMAPHAAMQQGAYYAQHPQAAAVAAAAMAQQSGLFPSKMPLQFNHPHQMQDTQQLHQAAMQGQMGMRPIGPNNGMHPMHTEATLGSSGPSIAAGSHEARGGSKQDLSDAGATGTDGQGGEGSEDAK